MLSRDVCFYQSESQLQLIAITTIKYFSDVIIIVKMYDILSFK